MMYILIYLNLLLEPASINVVFGYKQAQQYSRKHQLGFVRAVSWSAQNAESHCSHMHIILTVEHFNLHAYVSHPAETSNKTMFSIIVAVLFAIRIYSNSVHCLPYKLSVMQKRGISCSYVAQNFD